MPCAEEECAGITITTATWTSECIAVSLTAIADDFNDAEVTITVDFIIDSIVVISPPPSVQVPLSYFWILYISSPCLSD